MPLVETIVEANELVTLEEAKQHLRITSEHFDEEVRSKLTAAREWSEAWCARTLRPSTTRTLSMSDWWCGRLSLPYPPLLTVASVKYYDADDANQTLASTNYHVVLSTELPGYLEWADDATQPTTAIRPDAVRIEYTAGYATLPAKAKQAILMALTMFWGDGKGRDLEYAERSAKNLLVACDWGSYR